MTEKSSADQPLISAEQKLPELTIKVFVLSTLLTILLAASNAYLGLKVGTTVSASIPAAIISMAILRWFKNANVLENNIVQTSASVGESLAGAAGFVLPALIFLHYWSRFNYWETVSIIMCGGLLGALFSIPLRRILLSNKLLKFPEGTAIGHILRAEASDSSQIQILTKGGLFGGLIALAQTGFKIISDDINLWFAKKGCVFGFSIGFSPALIGAGYIVGINVGIPLAMGVVCAWIMGIPLLDWYYKIPLQDTPLDTAMFIWNHYLRFIGIGTMLVGGLWVIISLLKPMWEGLSTSYQGLRKLNKSSVDTNILRTEYDMPIHYVAYGIVILFVPITLLLIHFTDRHLLGISGFTYVQILMISLVFVVLMSFICSCICGYFAGLVGATNNPTSAILLASVLFISLIFVGLLSAHINFNLHKDKLISAAGTAIVIAAIIGIAATIANDNIQDLKAGQMVGATPWKQQLILIFGVVLSALVIAPVLELLLNAYGMAGIMPHAGMDPTQVLPAPQAGLIAAVAQGVFGHELPWAMIIIGVFIGVTGIIANEIVQRKTGHILSVLAIGLGIYLPLQSSTPLILGGLISYLAKRRATKRADVENPSAHKASIQARQRGIMLACGLVAGASIMGVFLAIPFVIAGSADVWRLVPQSFEPLAEILGTLVTLIILRWLYKLAIDIKP